MRISLSRLFLFLVLTTCIATVNADLSGQEKSGFQLAMAQWLADDDHQSLPLLSALADDGNRAARLLLSRIEFTDRSPQAHLLNNSRAKNHALFRHRVKDSPFPRSWITIEANRGNPLAQSLRLASEPGIDIDAIRHLYAIGEKEAAEHKIRKIAVDGSQQQHKQLAEFLGSDDSLAPYLRGFQFSREGMTTAKTAMQTILADIGNLNAIEIELAEDTDTRRAIAFVDIGYQAGRSAVDYDSSGRHFEPLAEWIKQDETANPLLRICQRHCRQAQQSACLVTAFGLIGGYYELHRFDSPLETLIPQQTFLSSARAEGMMLRRIGSARSEATVPVFDRQALAERSQCLAQAVSELY